VLAEFPDIFYDLNDEVIFSGNNLNDQDMIRVVLPDAGLEVFSVPQGVCFAD
jgi:hypothetical protein